MPKRKKTPNKAQIKREIAQFLATNQVSALPVQQLDIPRSDAKVQVSNVAISDQWSQTTTAEIKKIIALVVALLIILIALTVIDRKTSLVQKIGHQLTNAFRF